MRQHRKLIRRLRAKLVARGYARVTVRVGRRAGGWWCAIERGVARSLHVWGVGPRRVDAIRNAFSQGGIS